MTPHDLIRLPDQELADYLRKSLSEKDIAGSSDALAQIQARFDRLASTAGGARRFLDGFLPLAGRSEVRALRTSDKAVQAVARLEHLLDLAGERARGVTGEAVLRQIVESRERGMDLLMALVEAPQQGFTAGELARKLGITPQNLSPLLSVLHAYGLVDRVKQNRHVYVSLTGEGRAILPQPEPQPEVKPKFLHKLITGRKDVAA